jgi:FMN reductase
MSIVILSGSPSQTSRTFLLAKQLAGRLTAAGRQVDLINIRELPAEELLFARTEAPAIKAAVRRVEAASALVVATPIYKAAYSGIFKAFLDLLPQYALAGKTVLPLATGGSLAHVLSIDYALRPVLTALGARHVLPGYFFLDSELERFGDDGLSVDPAAAARFEPIFAGFLATLPSRAGLHVGPGAAAADTLVQQRLLAAAQVRAL